jgi:hypothetical protein
MTDRTAVTQVADRVLAVLQQPCWLNNHEVVVRGSIGLVIGSIDYTITLTICCATPTTGLIVPLGGC